MFLNISGVAARAVFRPVPRMTFFERSRHGRNPPVREKIRSARLELEIAKEMGVPLATVRQQLVNLAAAGKSYRVQSDPLGGKTTNTWRCQTEGCISAPCTKSEGKVNRMTPGPPAKIIRGGVVVEAGPAFVGANASASQSKLRFRRAFEQVAQAAAPVRAGSCSSLREGRTKRHDRFRKTIAAVHCARSAIPPFAGIELLMTYRCRLKNTEANRRPRTVTTANTGSDR